MELKMGYHIVFRKHQLYEMQSKVYSHRKSGEPLTQLSLKAVSDGLLTLGLSVRRTFPSIKSEVLVTQQIGSLFIPAKTELKHQT